VVNPRIGSRVKQTCTVEEVQPLRWCKTTERSAGGTAVHPQGRAATSDPESDFLGLGRWRGGLWKSQERRFGLNTESHGSGRDEKVGVKVRRVGQTFISWR
jgi:hypothetical protein